MRRKKQLIVVLLVVSIATLIVTTRVYQQSPRTSKYRSIGREAATRVPTTVSVYQQSPRTSKYRSIGREAATRVPTTVSAAKLMQKYDVILNSYMRSGSSMVGKILGFRNDTFYFYEPLIRRHTWEYLRGEDKICHYLPFRCKASMPSELTKDLAYLNRVLDCIYPENATYFFDLNQIVRVGGPKWKSYGQCLQKEKATSTECLEADVYKCKEALHRVSKVLRLTLDNLTPLLETRANLKVIHLYRDPRGILNSHLTTDWHRMAKNRKPDVIRQDVMSICDRMLYDVKAAKQLKRKFPDRFRVVQYEDFVDMLVKAGRIFDFVGMSYTQADRNNVDVLTRYSERLPEYKYVFTAWRKSLSWDHVKLVDGLCKDVYKELGYKAFVNEGAYMDPGIPSMEDPLPYAI